MATTQETAALVRRADAIGRRVRQRRAEAERNFIESQASLDEDTESTQRVA